MTAEDPELAALDESVRKFLSKHAPAAAYEKWRKAGVIPRTLWEAAAEAGYLGLSIADEYGGAGGDFRHEAVLARVIYELGLDAFALPLHNVMVAPYIQNFGTEEQKHRWLPGMVSGKFISAIAMTEPSAGSDLKAIRTNAVKKGDGYLIDGQKTFISNGQTANLIIVVCKTDPKGGAHGISLFVLETETAEGFRRGRKLEKIGLEAADTSELFFDEVRVPESALLGGVEGRGFYQLMEMLPQERLAIAVQGIGTMRRALKTTIAYVKSRRAFGKPLLDLQNTQFKLAECKSEATIAEVFVEDCIARHTKGELDAVRASMAKYWVTETQCKIIDECLQLHGGNGYMLDYPIAQMYRDSRVQKIYGGANEVMKVLIARSL